MRRISFRNGKKLNFVNSRSFPFLINSDEFEKSGKFFLVAFFYPRVNQDMDLIEMR